MASFDGVVYPYTSITYPQDFVWNGTYLNALMPGQLMTIIINSTMTQQLAVNTPFTHSVRALTDQVEYTTGNNSATVTDSVKALPDVWVSLSEASLLGYET